MVIGSITRLLSRQQRGWIPRQGGNEVYFDQKGLDSVEFSALFVGQPVQFDTEFSGERAHAMRVKVLGRTEDRRAASGHDRTPPERPRGTER
jgi:cold shock CspA family protein